jgi:hypothetical protein
LIQQSMKGAGGSAGMSVGHEGILWQITMPLPAASVARGPRAADLIDPSRAGYQCPPTRKALAGWREGACW